MSSNSDNTYFMLTMSYRRVPAMSMSTTSGPSRHVGERRLSPCQRPSALLMSTHASILVDSVGPPSAEVCRTATSFP
jgi:hypothetical protein